MTSIQEEIPADIAAKAQEVYASILLHSNNAICVRKIAAALLAERRRQIERDAEIADSDANLREGSLQADAGHRIADAIRRQIPADSVKIRQNLTGTADERV